MKQGSRRNHYSMWIFYTLLTLGLAACGSGTVSIQATDQTIGLYEGTQASVALHATTSDNSSLDYQIQTPPKFGTLSGIPPELVYTPHDSYIGADEFQFIATSGTTKSKPATIRLIVAPSLTLSDEKPSPVAVRLAQSYSPTELYIEWIASTDNTTPADRINYEIHASTQQDFFPSQETLLATVEGETTALIPNMTPGEQIYLNVIAVDMEGHRSLETKPISLKMAWEAVEFREDINIFVSDNQLSDPIFDSESGTITFTTIGTELPSAGDYLIIDAAENAKLVFVEDILSNNMAARSSFTYAAALGEPFQIKARPADFREIISSGDINLSTASHEGSAGYRLSEALEETDPSEFPWITIESEKTQFSCMDENLENPRINLASPIDNAFVHITGGIEIGCDINIEIQMNYRYFQLPTPPPPNDKDAAISNGGTIRTTGSVTKKLFGNIGYDAPILDSISRKIWASKKPIERSFKIKLPAKQLKLFGMNDVNIHYTVTPALNWKYGASKGQDIDIVTNDIMSYEFDETITFKSAPLLEIPYSFERKISPTTQFDPQFTTSHLLAKASVETEYEFHLDFLFGVRVNMVSFNKLGLTTGINSRFIAEGKTQARPHYDLLSANFENVTPYEMKYMSLRYQPSLQAVVAYNIREHDTYKGLDWWEKMLADATVGKALSGTISDIPLSIDSFILLNAPHYELTSGNENGQYTFTANLVEDTGTFVGILNDQTKWHELTSNDEFTLEPTENSDPPTATGRFASNSTRNATVAFEYLPELAKPLLENDPTLADELPTSEQNAFLNGMRKFALNFMQSSNTQLLIYCEDLNLQTFYNDVSGRWDSTETQNIRSIVIPSDNTPKSLSIDELGSLTSTHDQYFNHSVSKMEGVESVTYHNFPAYIGDHRQSPWHTRNGYYYWKARIFGGFWEAPVEEIRDYTHTPLPFPHDFFSPVIVFAFMKHNYEVEYSIYRAGLRVMGFFGATHFIPDTTHECLGVAPDSEQYHAYISGHSFEFLCNRMIDCALNYKVQ